MKEQSHKQEMDAAVRGDFERLRARGVATTIAVDGEPPAEREIVPGEAESRVGDRPSRAEHAARPSLRRLFRRG